jgi:hypothetical protein
MRGTHLATLPVCAISRVAVARAVGDLRSSSVPGRGTEVEARLW